MVGARVAIPAPLSGGLLVLLALAGGDARSLRQTQTSARLAYSDTNYQCMADPEFEDKCVPKWQESCRREYNRSEHMRRKLCEGELSRNYVKIRTLVPPSDILDQWKWEFERRQFDDGFFRSQVPKFTDTGFKLVRLPEHLHEGMLARYNARRNTSRPEAGQPVFGFHCNTGHDNDDWVVDMPHDELFRQVREWIRLQLSEWTGQNVNEQTSIYGAREYHRGSICGMHTDNTETHAFSAIYQLDQQGMDEPWPLHYVTHAGEEGRALMQAGHVMLYESASGLHGRKDPLMGDEFTNIFFHFRSPDWLPAIQRILGEDNYWEQRRRFEAHHRHLTSLEDAPPKERLWRASDQCIPERSRREPLLSEGGFMSTPPDPTRL